MFTVFIVLQTVFLCAWVPLLYVDSSVTHPDKLAKAIEEYFPQISITLLILQLVTSAILIELT